jgi:hypothetical protein
MTTVNPKAFPLANAQLAQQILDLVQQGCLPLPLSRLRPDTDV